MKIKQNLKCVLTLEEIAGIGRQLGNLNREQAQLKSQAKEAASQYKARIDSAQTQIEELSNTMNCGYEYRNVDCDVLYNTPTEGRKSIIRSDSGEKVEERPMTADESQDLFINGLGAKVGDQEFVFRDKTRCRLVTREEFATLSEHAKFNKIGESIISEEEMVDMKPESPEIALVVSLGDDDFELYEFISGKNPNAEYSEDDDGESAEFEATEEDAENVQN